ncbi:MAG: hypothetical protein IBX69_11255 [Anaerolineales bacterium]|nr:hypothetical protein [Anaerolineales bacterium]
MNVPVPNRFLIWLIFLAISLAGCNLFSTSPQADPTINVTQAYQTVEARLTEAIAQTPQVTITTPIDENEIETAAATTPTVETTPMPAITQPVTPSPTALCDHAAPGSPIDVTIPDDSLIESNQKFTKTWRLHNIGSCTWDESYAVVWFSGDPLGAQPSNPLQGSVPPGAVVDVSVDMEAPEEPGTYQSNWKLRNSAGVLFGIGPNADSSFWVRIQVIEPLDTTPSPTPTATPTPTPTATVSAHAHGHVTLNLDDRLDLDTLQVNSGVGEDVALTSGEQIHLLQPLGNALLASFGNNQPSLLECQESPLSADAVIIENIEAGTYVCYRTNMSLPGWMLIEQFNIDPVILEVEIYTWAIP